MKSKRYNSGLWAYPFSLIGMLGDLVWFLILFCKLNYLQARCLTVSVKYVQVVNIDCQASKANI